MAGTRVADRRDDARVVVARERGMDAALQAHLGRAALPGLERAPDDLLVRDEERRATKVLGELPLRERAEAAPEVADVRVLDVPRDDVGDRVAADLAPQPVGGREDALALLAAAAREAARARPPRARRPRARSARDRGRRGTEERPARPAPSDPRARARARRRPGGSAGATAGSAQTLERRRRAPGRAAAAGRARAPGCGSASRSSAISGHGASGLTWSTVTGDTPPQSSIPASSSRGKSS